MVHLVSCNVVLFLTTAFSVVCSVRSGIFQGITPSKMLVSFAPFEQLSRVSVFPHRFVKTLLVHSKGVTKQRMWLHPKKTQHHIRRQKIWKMVGSLSGPLYKPISSLGRKKRRWKSLRSKIHFRLDTAKPAMYHCCTSTSPLTGWRSCAKLSVSFCSGFISLKEIQGSLWRVTPSLSRQKACTTDLSKHSPSSHSFLGYHCPRETSATPVETCPISKDCHSCWQSKGQRLQCAFTCSISLWDTRDVPGMQCPSWQ